MGQNFNTLLRSFLIGTLASACVSTERVSNDFLQILNKNSSNNGVNFSGGYHRIRKELYNYPTDYVNGRPTKFVSRPYLDRPLFFFSNGLVCYDRVFWLDSIEFGSWMMKYGEKKWTHNNWGVYEMKGDTIKCIIFINYQAKSRLHAVQLLQTYFQGILTKDSILQWQMIPPYPKVAEEYNLNDEMLRDLEQPRDLHFKPIPIGTLVDPKKAWINEFR